MQVAASATSEIVAIVVSIATVIGVVARFGQLIPKYRKTFQEIDVGTQKVLELQEELYMVADAVNTAVPEVNSQLRAKYGKDISWIKERARIAAEQAKRLEQIRPAEFSASKIEDLPREDFETKPGTLLAAKNRIEHKNG